LRNFRERIENGEVVTKTKWTFDEYAKHYVDAREAAGEVEERTVKTLRSTLRQLGHRIGALNMQDVTPQVLEQAYVDLRAGDSLSGKHLSGRTIYNINLSAFLMFQDACEKGVIAMNPLLKVTRPKKDTKEKRALPAEAYRKLLSELDPTERMECAVLLCAALGLRRSESIALSWGDVDFEAGTINVHASCDESGGLKKTKTEAGNRILPMSPKLAEYLLERKAFMAGDFAENAPGYVTEVKPKSGRYPAGTVEVGGKHYELDSELSVTADEFGRRCKPVSFSTWWKKHCEDYGMDGWTLHELRHSFLSLAAASGVHPAIMQQLAGHSSAKTTMDIYTHVNMDSKRAAVMAMQDAFME
ncbi:MAG: site-specific integrase, partial [Atopobiaceae bacterium]|nr:site-specific integrase [Atopobiaceae bacterium]